MCSVAELTYRVGYYNAEYECDLIPMTLTAYYMVSRTYGVRITQKMPQMLLKRIKRIFLKYFDSISCKFRSSQ
jgi:hypothetical protein